MNNFAVKEMYSEKHTQLPNVSSLLKISLGLILFTMISTALVYAETMPVIVNDNSYDVAFTATGLTVSAIDSDLESFSLFVTVEDSNSSGTLEITLERSFFDSLLENGDDDEYFVLADGDFVDSAEIETTSQSRTLNMQIPSGTTEIEIIGTIFENPDFLVDDSDEAKAAADKAAADKAAADKAAADKAAADKAAADKAAADKAAADDTPKTQCGPGTILKDGACILDERCGPGTILKDGACILDSAPQTTSSSKGLGKESIIGFVAAFVIAGTVAVILGIIARASKSSN